MADLNPPQTHRPDYRQQLKPADEIETPFMQGYIGEVRQVPSLSKTTQDDLIRVGRESEEYRTKNYGAGVEKILTPAAGKDFARQMMAEGAWDSQHDEDGSVHAELARRGITQKDIDAMSSYGPVQKMLDESYKKQGKTKANTQPKQQSLSSKAKPSTRNPFGGLY
jgi:hypothetical protein